MNESREMLKNQNIFFLGGGDEVDQKWPNRHEIYILNWSTSLFWRSYKLAMVG